MADNFLTATFVNAFVGSAVRVELCSDDGSYSTGVFDQLCWSATTVIQNALSGVGYTAPSSLDAVATSAAEYLRMAAVGAWIELAYARPEHRLLLPDNWPDTLPKNALESILSGEAELELGGDTATSIGGFVASENDENITSSDGSRPHIFSRKGLSGL